jgi:hypothetical protein
MGGTTYLQLNLRLSNILLAAAAGGNLLGLGDLVPHGVGAEVLERVALDGVDAEDAVGLHGCEAAGHCQFIISLPLSPTSFAIV